MGIALRVGTALLLALAVTAALAFLLLPLIAIWLALPPARLLSGLATPAAATALALSFRTTFAAMAAIVALGTPLAYWLARARFRGKQIVDAAVQLPVVVPPAVAGVGLLLVFGRYGIVGSLLAGWHASIAFSTAAVVVAQAFVAGPFYVVGARQAFAAVDPDLVAVARTLGAGPARAFWHVELPLAIGGVLAGAALSWARALGEFGATMLFAGNFPGITQTLPLAIYSALDSGLDAAVAMAALLMFAAFFLLLLIRFLDWRMTTRAPRDRGAADVAGLPLSSTAA